MLILCSWLRTAAQEWQNQYVLQVGAEPSRAWYMPFVNTPGDSHLSLNGEWRFRWTPTPEERITNFYAPDFDVTSWQTIAVPANWEVNGYGTPIYVSAGFPFRADPPRVMSEPKKDWTTFMERNPTGQYRRTFTLPQGWGSGQTFLRFEGVMSAFYVWVNGQRVGYSQGSMEPSEFNITSYLHAGDNDLAVEVYKYSDGSYLEDQDFWRFGGIHRDVTLYHTPDVRISDYAVRTVPKDPASLHPDYLLQVNPSFRVHNGETGKGAVVTVRLWSDDTEQGITKEWCKSTSIEPILDLSHRAATMNEWYPQRGARKFQRVEIEIPQPRQWTAETPNLYNLDIILSDSLGNVLQQARQKIGFRHYSIHDGQLWVNNRPVRLRGVNRHEHDPLTARVMTEARMRQDISMMKEANINAVRLSHYPNVTRWYELCDSAGIYVMDEADCESHGLRGTLASDPTWAAAYLDRAERMAQRDKNVTSVLFWSLGNESGYGAAHAAMAAWLHEFDPTRPVHYEGAQTPYVSGGDDERHYKETDPATVDVISRFYPRVCEEYLNPGIAEGSDKERAENARWEHLLDIASRTNDQRPVMTSEYAHCMGNALGNFKEYWDEIYSNPRMLGGFIWDWVDQGIQTDKGIAYGGDFGDKPNLKAFCLNGVVMSHREKTAKYEEVRHVYSPVQIARHGRDIYVINRNHHITLDDYSVTVQHLSADGALSNAKAISVPHGIQPGDSAVIWCPTVCPSEDAGWYIFTVMRDGKEVATFQLPMTDTAASSLARVPGAFSAGAAAVSSIEALQITPQFFRAPTDNDTGFGNWLAKDWKNHNLANPEVAQLNDTTTEYRFAQGSIIVTTTKAPQPDGSSLLTMRFTPQGVLPELPRLGLAITLPEEYERLAWFGRGPWENYPDRKQAAIIGTWNSTVTDQYTHYPRPQDSGNHEDCSWVTLSTLSGRRFVVQAVDKPFSFSALHYTTHDIASATHDYELRPGPYTILSIDCAVLGLGNGSCGPGVLKKYSIDKTKEHTLILRMMYDFN